MIHRRFPVVLPLALLTLIAVPAVASAQIGIGVGVGRGFGYPGLGYPGGGYPYWGQPYGYYGRGINPAYTFGYRPEWNYGTYGYSNAPYFNSPASYNRFNFGYPAAAVAAYPRSPIVGSVFVPPPAPEKPALSDTDLLLRVFVPDSAQVWVNGALTTQTGTAREYITTDLKPGRAYAYSIKARWMEDGKPVERDRKVKVRAGEKQIVNLHVDE